MQRGGKIRMSFPKRGPAKLDQASGEGLGPSEIAGIPRGVEIGSGGRERVSHALLT
jgi:hypothetical protein